MKTTYHTVHIDGTPIGVHNKVDNTPIGYYVSYNNYDRAIYGCDTTADRSLFGNACVIFTVLEVAMSDFS